MKTILHSSFFILHLSLAVLLFHSCRQQPETPLKISRLEQSLFTIPIDSIPVFIPRLEQQYGELFDLYSSQVICIGLPQNPQFP